MKEQCNDVRRSADEVHRSVEGAYARFRGITAGRNADYIPVLAEVPSDLFAVSVVTTCGTLCQAGDYDRPFTIQSVSKPFVFALICQAIGEDEARAKLGVNSTGLPFNSVIAIERTGDGATNPMVNAGAIAATSLAPGASVDEKWRFIQTELSRFAGRDLSTDEAVYRSESSTNEHNEGLAELLEAYDRIYWDPVEATDIYTRQCALRVTTGDLAAMTATLANGGVNPVTGDRIIDSVHCQHVLAVMVTAGLYENSGDWLYETGLPGKSGVSGGMIAAAPGKCGIATFSPPLDEAGNSVRGQLVVRALSDDLSLNVFASRART